MENIASRVGGVSFDFDPLRRASSADDHALALCCVDRARARARVCLRSLASAVPARFYLQEAMRIVNAFRHYSRFY